MGKEMTSFTRNLTWTVFGLGTSSAIIFAINLLAGRLLAPVEYGKYNLVLSLSQIIMVFSVFGIDMAAVNFIAKSKSETDKKVVVSTSLMLITLNLIMVVIGTTLFLKLTDIADYFEISMVISILIYTALYSFRNVTDGIMRGLHKFKAQSLLRMVEVGVTLLTFYLMFFIVKKYVYTANLFATLTGVFALVIIYIIYIKHYLFKFDRIILIDLMKYGGLFFTSGVAGVVFGQLDKIIVTTSLGISSFGLYSAYFTASGLVSINLAGVVINVFFPAVSKEPNKLPIYHKLNRLTAYTILPLFMLMVIIVSVAMKIFGSKYQFNLEYILLFSILSVLQFFYSINNSLITTISRNLFIKSIVFSILISTFYLCGYLIFICLSLITITTVVTLMISYVICLMWMQRIILRNYFGSGLIK